VADGSSEREAAVIATIEIPLPADIPKVDATPLDDLNQS
jgi:hypothetical protein